LKEGKGREKLQSSPLFGGGKGIRLEKKRKKGMWFNSTATNLNRGPFSDRAFHSGEKPKERGVKKVGEKKRTS